MQPRARLRSRAARLGTSAETTQAAGAANLSAVPGSPRQPQPGVSAFSWAACDRVPRRSSRTRRRRWLPPHWRTDLGPGAAAISSLMRLAPVPMHFAGDAAEAISRSADTSRTTHAAEEAVDACRYFGGLLVGALRGVGKETLLSAQYCPVEGLWGKARRQGGSPLSPAGRSSIESPRRSKGLPCCRDVGGGAVGFPQVPGVP